MWTISSSHCLFTATMPLNEPFVLSRITSLLACAARTRTFPFISGIGSCHKWNSLLTYSKVHASTRISPPGCNCMVHFLISTKHLSPHPASVPSSTTSLRCAIAGPPMGLMGGTLGPPFTLTTATQYGPRTVYHRHSGMVAIQNPHAHNIFHQLCQGRHCQHPACLTEPVAKLTIGPSHG